MMFEFLPSATNWALHSAAAGVLLFAFGWAVVRRIGDPMRRQQLGGWLIRAGLLVAVLCALPAWLLLPLPGQDRTTKQLDIEAVPPIPVVEPLPPIPARDVQPKVRPGERLAIVIPMDEDFTPVPKPLSSTNTEATTSLNVADTRIAETAVPRTPTLPIADVPEPSLSPWPGIVRLVLLAYVVGAIIAAVPLLLGAFALTRLRQQAKPASPRVQAIFDELRNGRRVRLLVAPRLGSPVCFGLFRSVVILPEELAHASDVELRWVFAHELDHLRRGDPWTNLWVNAAKAVYFAVPWFWSVRRDLMLTQEYLADAAAAAIGRVEDYASFLVRLSESPLVRRHPIGANAVRAGKSDLYRRVTMLLSSKGHSIPRTSRVWSIAVACLTVGLAVVLSGIGFAQPDDVQTLKKAAPVPPPMPKPAEADEPLRLADPIIPGNAVRGPQIVIPVLGVAQIQALPVRPLNVAQPLPLIVPNVIPIAPVAGGDLPPPLFDPMSPAIFDLQAKIARLQIALVSEQAAKADDKDAETKIKALKAEIEKLTKDLEKMQKEAPQPNAGGKRVVVGGLPGQGGNFQLQGGGLGGNFQGQGFGGNFQGQGGLSGWAQVAPAGGGYTFEPRLGIMVDRVSPVLADQLDLAKGQGVVLSGVLKEQAADKAGLKPNDIVLEFAGKAVADNPSEFLKAVNAVKMGDKVDLVVLRKGKKETIKGIEVPEAKRAALAFPNDPFQGRPLNVVQPALPVQPLIPGTPAKPLPPKPALIPGLGGAGQSSMQVQIDGDTFSIQAIDDGIQYVIEGTAKDGKGVPTKIVITADGKATKADSLDKVPEAHKERVKQLLDSVKFGK